MRIFVTGFMGSGKTYWGRIWASKLHLKFIDLDESIEKSAGKSIIKIFDDEGEMHFRHLEKKMLESLAIENNVIIATGGGTPCYHDSMTWMNDNGITVYLKASAGQILSRVLPELHKRPLLKHLNDQELTSFIEDKLKEREPFYIQAKHIIPVQELKDDSLVSVINAK